MLSLSRPDPSPPSTTTGAVGKPEQGDSSLAAPLMKASWGSLLDLIEAQEAEGMHMELWEDEPPPTLTFVEDEEDVFIPMAKAEQSPAAAVLSTGEESRTLPAARACLT